MLPVGQGHRLYVEESGNPEGEPVLVLHGGPGGGSSPGLRRFFDPTHYRIILFDQRGAGRSRPLASIEDNSTDHLIEDIEVIRDHLKIDRWSVVGGSWGVTLALTYALRHQAVVRGLVLRGVFLCRPRDLAWLYQPSGAAHLFPDAWQQLLAAAPAGSESLLQRYYQGLQQEQARRLARVWCFWEATLAGVEHPADGEGSDAELCMARQETHYFCHQGFLPRPLLPQVAQLALPVEIVHGSHDFVCPPEQALALHRALPDSELTWVKAGSHSAADPTIAQALVAAIQRLQQRLKSERS